MIVPPIRKTGYGPHARSAQARARDEGARVEPVRRASTAPRSERRSGEALANANALHLGVAAQMLASHQALRAEASAHRQVLPTHPAMRMAARYASTAEGLAPTATLGFSRTV